MSFFIISRHLRLFLAPLAMWSWIMELAPAQEASTDSPEALIAQYESYVRKAPCMKLVLEEMNYFTEATVVERLYKDQRTEVTLDVGAHSIRVLTTPRPVPPKEAKDLAIFEQVYTPSAYFKVGSTFVEGRVLGIIDSRTKPLAPSDWRSYMAYLPFMACFGILPWDIPDDLVTRLRRMAVQVSSTEGDQGGLIRLSGADADLSLEVWLDPALQYCPKKIVFQRNLKNEVPRAIIKYAYEVERVQFVDGYPFPATYTVVCGRAGGKLGTFPEPGIAEAKAGTAQMKEYIVQPDTLTYRGQVVEAMAVPSLSPADFALTTKIPDGVRVRMVDAPQLEYRWFQGQVVPATDPRVLAAVQKASFQAAPSQSHPVRVWLAIASVAVLGVVMAILLWRGRAKR
jgi:hypothetical protein